MPFFDMPLEELQKYKPERNEPRDFDSFWQQSLAETRQHALEVRFEATEYHLSSLDAFDVTFNGYGGQPVKGWLILPKVRKAPLPCIVEYIGYGGGRGLPYDWLLWGSLGYANLIMDTRGQGSSWLQGDTPDSTADGSSVHYPGFMTLGILDPTTYYYRRLYCDAVRAVEAAQACPDIDRNLIAVSGGSQGGGLAIAVSGLIPKDICVAMPDVPFLCHFRRAIELVNTMPYNEITHFCKTHRDRTAQVFTTLSYFDVVNFAPRAQALALFSVGIMDDICPPSTVYAAYNHYAGLKHIRVWEFNQHEGGGTHQRLEKVRFLKKYWQ